MYRRKMKEHQCSSLAAIVHSLSSTCIYLRHTESRTFLTLSNWPYIGYTGEYVIIIIIIMAAFRLFDMLILNGYGYSAPLILILICVVHHLKCFSFSFSFSFFHSCPCSFLLHPDFVSFFLVKNLASTKTRSLFMLI